LELLIQEIVVGIFVLVMMFSVGLDLRIQQVLAVFKMPRLLLLGLLINYLVVPAIGVGVVKGLQLEPVYAVGLLLVVTTPGGPLGALLTQKVRGNLALATSLVVVMNVLNTIVTPFMAWLLNFAPQTADGEVPVLAMARTIIVFQLTPLAAALYWRHRWESSALRWQPRTATASNWLIGLTATGFIVKEVVKGGAMAIVLPTPVVIAIFSCVLASLLVGYALGFGHSSNRSALCMVTSVRSMALALLLATAWFPDPRSILTVASYSAVMFWLSLGVGGLIRTVGSQATASRPPLPETPDHRSTSADG
jgi:BASS family bile acid:Na+ symporter